MLTQPDSCLSLWLQSFLVVSRKNHTEDLAPAGGDSGIKNKSFTFGEFIAIIEQFSLSKGG